MHIMGLTERKTHRMNVIHRGTLHIQDFLRSVSNVLTKKLELPAMTKQLIIGYFYGFSVSYSAVVISCFCTHMFDVACVIEMIKSTRFLDTAQR